MQQQAKARLGAWHAALGSMIGGAIGGAYCLIASPLFVAETVALVKNHGQVFRCWPFCASFVV